MAHPFKITRSTQLDLVLKEYNTLSLLEDNKGNILIPSMKNIVIWNQNELKTLELINSRGTVSMAVYSMLQDNKGNIWFAGYYGLYKWDGKNYESYSVNEGMSEPVWYVYQDFENNIWAGTNSGLVRFSGKRFCNFSTSDGLKNDEVWAITEDADSNIWIAHRNGVSWIQSHNMNLGTEQYRIINHDYPNTYVNNFSRAFLRNIEGQMWIGTVDGMNIYSEQFSSHNKFIPFARYKLSGKSIFAIHRDKKKNIWIGTYGDGIFMLPYSPVLNTDPALFHYNSENGLCDNIIRCIYEDNRGGLWFATNAGCLNKLELQNNQSWASPVFQAFTEKDGLKNARILTITGDHKDQIWLGTYAGICRYDGKHFHWITEEDGLSSTTVYFLLADDGGFLWAGTNKGLDKLDLNEYYNNGKISIKHYGPLDGFTAIECNPNAAYKDHKGNLWFGTVKGVFKYTPDEDKINNVFPKTHITNIRLFFKEFDWSEFSSSVNPNSGLPINLSLPYDKNHLTFDFAGLSLTIPEKVLFQYKLEGLDADWSPPTSNQSVTYSGVVPGDYSFKVKACNNDGIWNKEPVILTIRITPPFWKTWWFYSTLFIVITTTVFIIIRMRISNLQRAKKLLEEKVKQRTFEIHRQKEIIEQKNKDITDSIEYARYLQEAFLPDIRKLKKLLPDIFIFYLPRDIISGDFYWFCEIEGKVMVAACDCTGHGVPGAMVSILCSNLLFQAVFDHGKRKPGEILSEVNRGVIYALKQEGASVQANEGMDAALCVYDKSKNEIEFAGAVNSAIVVSGKGVEEVRGDLKSVGGTTGPDFSFTTHTIPIKQEMKIYLFSDGFHSQFGGTKGKKLTRNGFKEIIQRISGIPFNGQEKVFAGTFSDWKGNNDQVDDVLLIGLKF